MFEEPWRGLPNLHGVCRTLRGVSRTRSQNPVWGFGEPSGVPLPSAKLLWVRQTSAYLRRRTHRQVYTSLNHKLLTLKPETSLNLIDAGDETCPDGYYRNGTEKIGNTCPQCPKHASKCYLADDYRWQFGIVIIQLHMLSFGKCCHPSNTFSTSNENHAEKKTYSLLGQVFHDQKSLCVVKPPREALLSCVKECKQAGVYVFRPAPEAWG